MSFGLDLKRFSDKVEARVRLTQQRATELAFQSIVEGSPISGAPGQPVDTGALKASWRLEVGPLRNRITSDLIYAPQIEDGTREGRALTLRSKVGGFHSVMLTRIAWPKLVQFALAEAKAAV